VQSTDKRGRELAIEGYSNFRDQLVGRLTLHVDRKKALMIIGYSFEDHLITFERPEVLGQLVLCAQAIATRLHRELQVGTGSVLWQLEVAQLAGISRRFPQFDVLPRHKRFRRGKRYLIWSA